MKFEDAARSVRNDVRLDALQHVVRPLVIPVILCGGAGTRLWPASRESMPKQFVPLTDAAESTFQTAVRRVVKPEMFAGVRVVASADARFIVAEQLAAIGVSADILLEPERCDSALAVAIATCHAARHDPEAVVVILAADHVVDDEAAFVQACRDAALGACGGLIMTLGVAPTHPATGFGYIMPGDLLPDAGTCRHVERFVEKPDSAGAVSQIAAGALWNSGNFLFRADVMIAELALHAPAVLAAAEAALAGAVADLDFIRLDKAAYASAPRISIDHAVLERTTRAGVLPVSFPWSDLGSWGAIWDACARDAQGNVMRGRAEVMATTNSLVYAVGDQLTTVVGLDGVVVVTTPDAILVTSRAASEDVKGLVAQLRRRRHPEADEHRRMYRPWGSYQRIDIGSRFQVKRITVNPGGRLSLQKHHHRAEHWVVVRGTAEVTLDAVVSLVHENEAIYLPIGSVHRLANPGKIALELIEVQVGSYTGEDDIIRIEDQYGR